MPTYIDTTNLSPATIAQLQGPVITQIQITNSSYTVIDDTAVSTSGGYIKITGSNFTAGTQVVIGTAAATSVTFVNSTTLNVQVPAQSAGSYVVYVTVNTGSVAILVNGLTYSGTPTWVTGSTLTPGQVNQAISIQLSATGDAPLTYALAAGSSLPPGVTLTSGGLLSGTVTGITSETVYNFTINAIDAEAQDSPRGFSITITANDQYFNYVTALLSANTPASTFVTDASTNAFNVTVNGDVRPSNFGPYTPGYYSGSFSSGGISWPGSAALALGTGDFTIECWVNYTSEASRFLTNRVSFSAGSGTWSWSFNSTSIAFVTVIPGEPGVSNSSVSIPTNRWNHLAVVRSSGVITFYVNGTSFAGGSFGYDLGNTDQSYLLGSTSEKNGFNFTGSISNLRIVKGTALYTSSFTPSTTPLTAVANTQLLICQSNRFRDESNNNVALTASSATISGFDPFVPSASFAGRGSGYFDGSGDTLSISADACPRGTEDFTIEFWYYPLSLSSAERYFVVGDGTNALIFGITYSGNDIGVIRNVSGAGVVNFGSRTQLTVNAWNYIAVTRSGTTFRCYINGNPTTTPSGTSDYSFATPSATVIGAGSTFGNITDLRIVRGTALYTGATMTVPTAPLTAVANTSLLTLQNNQPNNNSMFLDSSTNNFNITRNGNTTQGTFSPYGGGWSVNFPNSGVMNAVSTSGAYLRVTNTTAFDMGTGDFTMEGWIRPLTLPNSDAWPTNWWQHSSLFGRGSPSVGDGYNLILGATRLIFQNNDTNVANGLHGISVGNWYHVAACRSSGTLRLFVNGVQVASASFSGTVGGGSNFYIGCETGEGAYFNGYMSNVRVLKGTALYTTTFTPSTTPLTPITNTQLLTCSDNRFLDDSFNNYTVVPVNSPTIQRFNPFNPVLTTPTSYSGYFDGTGDYLSVVGGTALGSGNFTIEMWVYFSSYPNAQNALYANSTGGNATATAGVLYINSTGTLAFFNNPVTVAQSTGTVTLNQWVHVAAVRSSGTIRLYINGVQDGSGSNSTNISDTTMLVMQGFGGISASPIGYASNLRVVVGTAVYTSNFTPSTTPLTAVANTALLTCQNATFIDNSANNYTITAFGNAAPRQFNPFGWTSTTGGSAAYTPALYGGSGYFDGSGDYLNLGGQTSFAFGTGNFTIEFWYYSNNSGVQQIMYDSRPTSTNGAYMVVYKQSSNVIAIYVSDVARITGSTNIAANAWYHIAVCRSGTNTRLFVNGVQDGSTFTSDTFSYLNGANRPVIGIDGTTLTNDPVNGYISDLRVINGAALYTSNFQPPVAPLTALQNTVLLNNMTGAGIYDSSMMGNYETVGNSSISTSLKKYGNTSMYFDGTGDHLYAPWNPGLEFGSGNFTIEFWAYISGGNALYCWSTDWHYGMTFNYGGASSNRVGIWASSNGSSWNIFNADGGGNGISTGTITLNTWTHVALVRNGSTWTLYLNGTSAWTGSSSATIVTRSSDTFRIAGPWPGAGPAAFNGYLDDFRITNGVARYTTNFTPPASPFINF